MSCKIFTKVSKQRLSSVSLVCLPFKLIYTRTLEQVDPKHKHKKTGRKDKHSKIVVETKTVEDIWDYEYTDMVSLEGTYEAIEVRDAYCVAREDVNYT